MKLNTPNSINGRSHEKFLLGIICTSRLFVYINSNTLKTDFNGTLLKKVVEVKNIGGHHYVPETATDKITIIFTKRSEIKDTAKKHKLPPFTGYIGTTAAGSNYCFNLTRLQLNTHEITRHEGGRLG